MLEELKGTFWTRDGEMVEDVVAEGYDVLSVDYEHICVADSWDDGEEHVFKLIRAGTTVAIGEEVTR